MRKKISIFGLIPAVILGVALVYLNPTIANAKEQCSIIPFEAANGLLNKTVELSPGDCVVWLNWTGSAAQQQNSQIIISFDEGQKCIEATVPSGVFTLEPASKCFISQALGYGQTVSLVFNKPGTYKYHIKSTVGPEQTGQIVVK